MILHDVSPVHQGEISAGVNRRHSTATKLFSRADSRGAVSVASGAPDFATLRFSTEDLPPREGLAFLREVIGREICRLDIEPTPCDRPFAAEGVLRALPGLGIISTASTCFRVERTPELMADGSDDLIMGLIAKGVNTVWQLGRETVIANGDAALFSSADRGGVIFNEPSRLVGLRLPRAALAPLVPGLEDAFVRRMPRDSEALRLLAGYLNVLRDNEALASPELRRLVVTHVYDLAALAIGAGRDATYVAEGRGVRAGRLNAVKADIAAHLGDMSLSVVAVAARQRVTPRYVQMLFESEGTTFTEYVLGQRLIRAHRMLSNLRNAGMTITAVAFEAGFGDLSYFHRTFRRTYGEAPSDVRAAAFAAAGV
ncbi:MAG: helix-turn-helix domain-containing protein [Rhizobiales bacterium]|nr:helix-turn-helix domain-containing protein [Hyphomicrobiales bacterium]